MTFYTREATNTNCVIYMEFPFHSLFTSLKYFHTNFMKTSFTMDNKMKKKTGQVISNLYVHNLHLKTSIRSLYMRKWGEDQEAASTFASFSFSTASALPFPLAEFSTNQSSYSLNLNGRKQIEDWIEESVFLDFMVSS